MADNITKQSLALKYRPQRFQDIVEQDAIKQILFNEVKTGNLKRCLMFTGPAGCGKTTSGRIFAHEIEENKNNIIEINCADNTGVDDIRVNVLDQAKSKPLFGKYKIFILDECHQLTTAAQNALLKVLEEPPEHCIFILCTTDPQKVLSTILSRVFRYDFQLISYQGIIDRLNYILTSEQQDPDGCGVQSWDDNALSLISTASQGHMRNAIVLLEKIISFTKTITVEDVERVLGVTSYDLLFNILDCILNKNQSALISSLDSLSKTGMDLRLFVKNFLAFVLDVDKYVILSAENISYPMSFITIPSTYEKKMQDYHVTHKDSLKMIMRTLIELNASLKWETNVKPVLETQFLLMVV